MILQALNDYYDRKANDTSSGTAPLGWEIKELPFLFVIDENGIFMKIEDTREIKNKKKIGKKFLIPQSKKRANKIVPNLLFDSIDYVIGKPCKDKTREKEKHAAFIEQICEYISCEPVKIVHSFLTNTQNYERIIEDPLWNELQETCPFASFRIVSEIEPVFRHMSFIKEYEHKYSLSTSDGDRSICLITGKSEVAERLHPAIKGVRDTNTSGANIVSFNKDSSCSFGKKQGENAPIGKTAAFKYTTALNMLLGKESKQKMQIGDATTVFWSSRPSTLEDDFVDFFDEPPKDNPDKNVAKIERLLNSVKSGDFQNDNDPTIFYVLGLSPNAARISIRFWQQGTVSQMEQNFARWFNDLQLIHSPEKREHLSLFTLLRSLASQNDSKNLSPNLAGEIMRSILSGGNYPATLLSSSLLRIKAKNEVSYPLVKLIKAYLVRNKGINVTMALDKTKKDVSYRLGRLFATLEKIQQDANPGINATIRDRYYASASSTPSAVFGVLMRLKNHHLSKLNKTIFYEQMLADIMSEIMSFPTHLSMEDQGMFAIGYYHQRQDFYTKKTEQNFIN